MALFKRDEKPAGEPAGHPGGVEEIKQALKDHGIIDVDRITRKRDLDRRTSEAARQSVEAVRQDRENNTRLDREAAEELVKSGHLIIKVDGKFLDAADLKCSCGEPMHEALDFVTMAASMWREAGDNKEHLVMEGVGRATPLPTSRGLPCFLESLMCRGCGTRHRVFVEVIL